VLTKPIGTGILSTAVKRGLADEGTAQRLVAVMRELNRKAAASIAEIGASACTDVTGFGLLGHLREMAVASGVDVELDQEQVPVLPGAAALAAADVVPGGTVDNLRFVESYVEWPTGQSRVGQLILADAQTSGGLLIAVADDKADSLLEDLTSRGVGAARAVGRVTETGTGRIAVI
jgi:selenide,water dikinase